MPIHSMGDEKPLKPQKPLGARARAFAHAYLADPELNGTAAAVAVGVSPKTAANRAWRWLKDPRVKAIVDPALLDREAALKLKAVRVVEETYRLATADLGELYDESGNLLQVKDMPEDVRRALAGIEVDELFEGSGDERTQTGVTRKVKLHDKRAAQELFLKWAGKLKDKVEHELSETLEQLVLKSMRAEEPKP